MTNHKMSQSREYKTWAIIKNRCTNKNFPAYRRYGAKGFTICKEWLHFHNFFIDMGEMPADCNGIVLADGCIEFCKKNCSWGYNHPGKRHNSNEQKVKQKTEYVNRKIKEPCSITLVIEKSHILYIRKQAALKSLQEGRLVTAAELIRESLAQAFPNPKQFDMFGKKNDKKSK